MKLAQTDDLVIWLGQTHTESARAAVGKQRENAFRILLGLCETTSDPGVRAQHQRYKILREMELLLTHGDSNEPQQRDRTGQDER